MNSSRSPLVRPPLDRRGRRHRPRSDHADAGLRVSTRLRSIDAATASSAIWAIAHGIAVRRPHVLRAIAPPTSSGRTAIPLTRASVASRPPSSAPGIYGSPPTGAERCPPAGRIASHRDAAPAALALSTHQPAAGRHRRRRRAGATRRRLTLDCRSMRRRPASACRNSELKDLGWELSSTFREGYTSVLATRRAYVEAHPEGRSAAPRPTTAGLPSADSCLRPSRSAKPTNAAGFAWRREVGA